MTKSVPVYEIALLWGLVASMGGVAQAHPLVDEARRRLDGGDFPGAIEAAAEAMAGAELTRAELIDALDVTALAQFGVGDHAAMAAPLEWLAAIDPEHRLSGSAGPELQEAFEAARQGRMPLRLRVELTPHETGIELRAIVDNAPEAMVRETRIDARVDGSEWERSTSGSLAVALEPGATVEYHAEAIGPGGAPLAAIGSAEAPERYRRPNAVPLLIEEEEEEGDDETGDGPGPGLLIGLGSGLGAALVVGLTVLLVLLLPPDRQTTIGPPDLVTE